MIIEKLENLIKADIKLLGFELWGIEISNVSKKNNKIKVTIYIDKKSGVSIKDCEKVNKEIYALINSENIFSKNYILEISSPGINKRIFKLSQIKLLNMVKVKLLKYTKDNNKYFQGKIKKVINNEITIETKSGKLVNFNFNNIDKIRIVSK